MVKVFILGLDGLEYNFVEKWNLTHIKQHEYGKIQVPRSQKGVPLTPEVWASFLTGKYVRGIEFARPFWIEKTLKAIKFMRRHLGWGIGLGRKITWPGDFPKLDEKTFLDSRESRTINAPFYNYENEVLKIVHAFGSKKLTVDLAVESLKLVYEIRKRQILAELKDATEDIIFAYMHFPDALHHFLFPRPSEIEKLYLDLDRYISRLNTSAVCLIVSDHGFDMKTKDHSNHGFYSCNVPLDPKPRRITDFYQLVSKHPAGGEHTSTTVC